MVNTGRNGINPETGAREKSALLALLSGKRILEVGAGSGRTTFVYASAAESVDAIDVDAKAIGLLKKQAKENGLSGNIKADAQSLFELDSGKKYDLTLFTFSLHEMPSATFRASGSFRRLSCFTFSFWRMQMQPVPLR